MIPGKAYSYTFTEFVIKSQSLITSPILMMKTLPPFLLGHCHLD